MVVAGAGLVPAPPSGPGVAVLAGGTAGRLGGQVQQAAGFGHADLDHARVPGRGLIRGCGKDPGVGPAGRLGGRAGHGRVCGLRGGGGRFRAGGCDGEQCERAHGQHGVAVEGVPEPDLMLVEAGLPFCLLSPSLGVQTRTN